MAEALPSSQLHWAQVGEEERLGVLADGAAAGGRPLPVTRTYIYPPNA